MFDVNIPHLKSTSLCTFNTDFISYTCILSCIARKSNKYKKEYVVRCGVMVADDDDGQRQTRRVLISGFIVNSKVLDLIFSVAHELFSE
jgi:hypothetical protein